MAEASVQTEDTAPSSSGSPNEQLSDRRATRINKLLKLYKRENRRPIRIHHLQRQFAVTPEKRAVIIDCMCRLHIRLKLKNLVFQSAVSILDEYLQAKQTTTPPNVIFLGVGVLFTAARNLEPLKASFERFLGLMYYERTLEEFQLLEQEIFAGLHYNFSRPTHQEFLVQFSLLGKFSVSHFYMANYFTELAFYIYEFAYIPQSKLSAAALLLAMHFVNQNCDVPIGFDTEYWSSKLEQVTRSSAQELRPICIKLAVTARHAPNMNLKAVYEKYQAPKYHMISKCSQLSSVLMDSICDRL